MNPNIGLNDSQRQGVIDLLSRTLADAQVLYTKTRNFHWNVVGPQFNDLHKFFEGQYDELAESIDDIAERIRMLGGKAPATLAEYVKLTRLKEEPGRYPNARTMIGLLLADHETIIRQLREDIDTCDDKLRDAGTADFLTAKMEDHEKMAWMLRACLDE